MPVPVDEAEVGRDSREDLAAKAARLDQLREPGVRVVAGVGPQLEPVARGAAVRGEAAPRPPVPLQDEDLPARTGRLEGEGVAADSPAGADDVVSLPRRGSPAEGATGQPFAVSRARV